MTNDELAARMIVLEAFSMGALGLAMQIVGVKLTKRQMINLTDGVKAAALGRLEQEAISRAGRVEGVAYLDELLSAFSEKFVPPGAGQSKRKGHDK